MSNRFSLQNLDPSIVVEPKTDAKSVVIWLHGLGADGHDFEGILPQLNLPDSHNIRFIFPHAPVQPVTINGGMAMRSWYDIVSTTIADRADLAGIDASRCIVDELIEQQIEQGIAADKILLAGFSQGGLVALHSGLHSQNKLAGVLALSTYYPQQCLRAVTNNVPVFMAHGLYDQVIPVTVAQQAQQLFEKLELPVEWQAYPMEHQVCQAEIEAISNWLQKQLLEC